MYAYFDESIGQHNSNSVSFAIEYEGNYIGHCSLIGLDSVNRACELQIEIGDKQHQGQGFGRNAVRLLLEYAFVHGNMNRIWLRTHSLNERAMRCYLACGFVKEGRLRQHIWLKGNYVDIVLMGVLREESEFV